MSSDFLLELLSEEIPARMQAKARNDLARMMAEELDEAGLKHEGIVTYSTPRRLTLIARGIPFESPSVRIEAKGPRVGAPEQALSGFLQKHGLQKDQLVERDGVYFAERLAAGRPTSNVLAFAVERIVQKFPWPKSMRWGAASASTSSMRWVRPLHSIVALLGEEIVPVAIEGVTCGAATLGHRFHHPGAITIGGAHDYVEKLRACHVLVDHAEREAIVRKGAAEAAKGAGFGLVEDEGLVVENAGLTEWPVPLLGSFDADYLDVPPEVIQLTARTNQKYFVMRDGAGKLAPHFVCVANIDANDGGAAIIAGNERVLAARLSDARFFWQQDVKVPLEEQAKKLEQIVFHEKLGTVADKVERVAKLAEWLVTEGIVKGCSPADAKRAAELCKADLVTGMVGEFPELQGIIGGHLARAQGESDAIADAIRDHYKPVGQGDDVPTAQVTVAVSLADKLDSLGRFFKIDELPTGSKDPFALRRAALGVLRIIREGGLDFDISTAIKAALYLGSHEIDPEDATSQTWRPMYSLNGFFLGRLGQMMKDEGRRHDLIAAVIPEGGIGFNVSSSINACDALAGFLSTSDGRDLLSAYKRAGNILKKEQWDAATGSDANVLSDEAALASALDSAEPTATVAVEAEDFTTAMSALASLRAPIDAFFDKVIVNDPDAGVRARRLNLLARFRDAVHAVADFSKIEG